MHSERGDLRDQVDRIGPSPPAPAGSRSSAARAAGRGASRPPSRRRRQRSTCPPAWAASRTAAASTSSRCDGDDETPLPWVNVIANQRFGTIVTSGGAAHTWARQQPRAAADAVCQRPGDRPDRRGAVPPRRRIGRACGRRPRGRCRATRRSFEVRHTPGRDADHDRTPKASTTASRSSSTPTEPVKLSVLTLANPGSRDPGRQPVRLLGVAAGAAARRPAPARGHRYDPEAGAVFARNLYTEDAGTRVAFAAASEPVRGRDRRPHRLPRPQRHA